MRGRTDGRHTRSDAKATTEARRGTTREKISNRDRIVRARAIGYDGAGGEWKSANGRCDGGGRE